VSFDLGVLSAAKPLTADEARDAYHHLASGADWSEVLQEDAHIALFVAALSARWPDIGEVESSPAHVFLSISGRAPDEAVEFCETKSSELGLNLFDPQDETLYSPGQEPQKATPLPQATLICQRCGKLIEPGTPHAASPRLLHLECLSLELP
jgi:hypothetical protein